MGPGLAGVASLTITWGLPTAGVVVLSSTRSAKPTGVSGFSAGPPVRGSNAYRMIRTRSVGAAGVKVPSCSYVWAVVFHAHVVPSRDDGTTLALIPECRVLAARRSACSRRGASAYGWLDVRGAVIGTAWSRAPAGVVTVAGEPVAVPIAPKPWNAVGWDTPQTAWGSGLRCCGLAGWGWGPLLFLQAGGGAGDDPRAPPGITCSAGPPPP